MEVWTKTWNEDFLRWKWKILGDAPRGILVIQGVRARGMESKVFQFRILSFLVMKGARKGKNGTLQHDRTEDARNKRKIIWRREWDSGRLRGRRKSLFALHAKERCSCGLRQLRKVHQ